MDKRWISIKIEEIKCVNFSSSFVVFFLKKNIPENRTFSFKNAEKTLKTINMEDEA